MSTTVDCGEGRHRQCVGIGHVAYLFPQDSRSPDEPPFFCGCRCHHTGIGTPCADPHCPASATIAAARQPTSASPSTNP